MADTDPILAAIDDVIALWHDHEMHSFHSLHDEEGHAWSGRVDELRHIRDLVQRVPHLPMQVT